MSVGQTSLDSLTNDANPPIKCGWFSQPFCGRCGVRLSKVIIDDSGNAINLTEVTCAHCGQVNRLD